MWVEVTKDKFFESVSPSNALIRTEKNQTVWLNRFNGANIGKSDKGWMPDDSKDEKFFLWRNGK